MIMYVTIKGDYVEAGREVGVRIDPIQIGYPLSGTMTVENTGNADFTMGKTLRIKAYLAVRSTRVHLSTLFCRRQRVTSL